MSENNTKDSGHLVGHVVVEVIKTILYIRGQFPVPLEELRSIVSYRNQKGLSGVKKFGNVKIFCDSENVKDSTKTVTVPEAPISRHQRKHPLSDAITKIDEIFENLSLLLKDNKVLELVISLGNSFMIPTETYHIKLPKKCEEDVCAGDFISIERCKRQIMKDLFENRLIHLHMPSEKLMPIYIMLLLVPGAELTRNMECKRFYEIPKSPKQFVMHLNSVCTHTSDNEDTKCTVAESGDSTSANSMPSLWVKLKPDIKGLPNKSLNG